MSLRRTPSARPPINGTIFNTHFERFFTKSLEKETLVYNKTNVGPKITPKQELSGAPTFMEVQKAIKGLSWGTAPGSNGLRPELSSLAEIFWQKELVTLVHYGQQKKKWCRHTLCHQKQIYYKHGRMLMLSHCSRWREILQTLVITEVSSFLM